MSCPPCNHNCRQGRNCPARIEGLHTESGGHSVHGGIAFPIDEPVATPEEAEGWSLAGLWFLAAVTVACVAGVVIAYLKS